MNAMNDKAKDTIASGWWGHTANDEHKKDDIIDIINVIGEKWHKEETAK